MAGGGAVSEGAGMERGGIAKAGEAGMANGREGSGPDKDASRLNAPQPGASPHNISSSDLLADEVGGPLDMLPSPWLVRASAGVIKDEESIDSPGIPQFSSTQAYAVSAEGMALNLSEGEDVVPASFPSSPVPPLPLSKIAPGDAAVGDCSNKAPAEPRGLSARIGGGRPGSCGVTLPPHTLIPSKDPSPIDPTRPRPPPSAGKRQGSAGSLPARGKKRCCL